MQRRKRKGESRHPRSTPVRTFMKVDEFSFVASPLGWCSSNAWELFDNNAGLEFMGGITEARI